MLVTFHCDSSASITMFGDNAIELLKMMGHSGTVPSAILAADVPAALARIRKVIGALDGKIPRPTAEQGGDDAGSPPAVTLAQYSFPLIDLLTAAANEGSDVTWEEGSR